MPFQFNAWVAFALGGVLGSLLTSYTHQVSFTPPTPASPITQEEILQAQKEWGDAIVRIGKAHGNNAAYQILAENIVDALYAYDEGPILFKPTKAAKKQFRPTEAEAISYFVTGIVPEDQGFALQPWSKVRFENSKIAIDSDSAVAIGNYYFTNARTGQDLKVEYTFGYQKANSGKLLINLHHSSLPYKPSP
ncbi:hypothetical protein [Acaryochloris marina]|uniref:Phosphoribosyl-AMP cyclohydrolase n=1 Tax=Acaryochloris marina (strain MBIC 11017) TaxID=329726 RepID=B0C7V7_ACAM1|nr:hypothetical protein [Acaryochloris marina]ABW26498.1 conserved hypothetical protein [Acaryochloris marina MBIC11017]BDM81307.1 phosphoribosyl-AMP cyclohydrolase [Acaryochloris marina MBIC10699]